MALDKLAPPEIEQSDEARIDPFWQAVLAVVRVLGWVLLVTGLIASPVLGVVATTLSRRRSTAGDLNAHPVRVADRVVYVPEEPSAEEADTVWVAVASVRAWLGDGRTRQERWRAAISSASLRRYPGATPALMGGRTA